VTPSEFRNGIPTFRFRFALIAVDGAKVIAELSPANRGFMMAVVCHCEMKFRYAANCPVTVDAAIEKLTDDRPELGTFWGSRFEPLWLECVQSSQF